MLKSPWHKSVIVVYCIIIVKYVLKYCHLSKCQGQMCQPCPITSFIDQSHQSEEVILYISQLVLVLTFGLVSSR